MPQFSHSFNMKNMLMCAAHVIRNLHFNKWATVSFRRDNVSQEHGNNTDFFLSFPGYELIAQILLV